MGESFQRASLGSLSPFDGPSSDLWIVTRLVVPIPCDHRVGDVLVVCDFEDSVSLGCAGWSIATLRESKWFRFSDCGKGGLEGYGAGSREQMHRCKRHCPGTLAGGWGCAIRQGTADGDVLEEAEQIDQT